MDSPSFECYDPEATCQWIASILQVPARSVAQAIELFQQGNTLPFIARYRKEATGNLDEIALRAIEDHWNQQQELADRKASILKSLHGQELLTPDLQKRVLECQDRKSLEILYLPYKPRRRTRATVAREQGLEPLADVLMQQSSLPESPSQLLDRFVASERGVPDRQAALQGACDIVAERWSEDAETREWLLERVAYGQVISRVKRGKQAEAEKYEAYFDHAESVRRIPSHRFLAMMRGQNEGLLSIGLQLEDEEVLLRLKRRLLKSPSFPFRAELEATVVDSYRRLMMPAVQSSVFEGLKEKADAEAIQVFASNLRQLLLAPPAGPWPTLGIDPGFRTGCKLAAVDGTGKYLQHATIYPTAPKNDVARAEQTLLRMISEHDIRWIAIGNGTASRETDAFVRDVIRRHQLEVTPVVVSESGASIYSASEIAIAEYPDLDLTIRGAISIAHRLQDPLAELVKLDPKSIGVGQYQHDVHQGMLKKSLTREVESCVNLVGVNLNQASMSLLSHVAGIGPKLATAIVDYREKSGRFTNRQQLLKVPKLGKKAFQQAAGFLRLPESSNPLDRSGVHPESYYVVQRIADQLDCPAEQLIGDTARLGKIQYQELVDSQTGMLTVQDIIRELEKPGRDPRQSFQTVQFAEEVNEISDLHEGMKLEGVVTNVTRFGAFVDIGVHQDGLIHISEMANRYVADPSEEVSVGDVIQVQVLSIEPQRKRIALSRKACLPGSDA